MLSSQYIVLAKQEGWDIHLLSLDVTMVFLVFDSNNEIEETLKDQKLTKIASDMHELIT